jgi:penicillin-binding protein 1A
MMAAGLANAVADFMRSDKSIPDAILDGIKTIPFVGAFANLGEAIYENTFGAADKAAEELVKKQMAARDSMLAGAARKNEIEAENAAARGSLMLENRRLELEQQVAVVKMSGNEAGIARAEYEQKLSLLNMETNLERAKTEDEAVVKMIDERHDRKVSLLMMERDLTLKNLDEAAKKEAEQNQKLADDNARQALEQADAEEKRIKRETEASQQAAEKLRMQELKDNEERIKQIADLEQERVSSQQAGIGSAQTALGSFKFDAYPASDKRKNDERLVGLMTNIRDQQRAAGFI